MCQTHLDQNSDRASTAVSIPAEDTHYCRKLSVCMLSATQPRTLMAQDAFWTGQLGIQVCQGQPWISGCYTDQPSQPSHVVQHIKILLSPTATRTSLLCFEASSSSQLPLHRWTWVIWQLLRKLFLSHLYHQVEHRTCQASDWAIFCSVNNRPLWRHSHGQKGCRKH